MIDPKRSKFKRKTNKYKIDSLIEIIDIEEAIKKNKPIYSCKENFIYSNYLNKEIKPISYNLEEYVFEFDNGQLKYFTEYYKVIDVLGQGCYGMVLSAYDLCNKNNVVAIKIIPKYKFTNINDYLKREVQIQAEMNHKNVLKLNYVRENINYIFLVMDLMEGGSLKDLMIKRYKRNGVFFSDQECSLIIKNILEGLSYLHSFNVLHRDIKPENIMLRYKDDLNSLTICDFGFSTILEEEKEYTECGTLIYMAPELFKNQVNSTIDCWACGFILYMLCSGGLHPIYKQNMSSETYLNKLKTIKQWTFPDEFPILARNIFLKLCKLDKHRRYDIQSALLHPWITRCTKTQIPLTLLDKYRKQEIIMDFKSMLITLIVLNYFNLRKNKEPSLKKSKTLFQKNKGIALFLLEKDNNKEKTNQIFTSNENKVLPPLKKNYSPPTKLKEENRKSIKYSFENNTIKLFEFSPTKIINSGSISKKASSNSLIGSSILSNSPIKLHHVLAAKPASNIKLSRVIGNTKK